eukprot:NODE_4714_length_1857_cov_5.473988.p1 GENE.NODE_4714_length_1857_cov_5.473988~~NODE_4714_length_1857_cov_5.473988.p1  ORF type:complete len:566 (-),score=109.04 NODE_4714_length_1857_cov_5.473988:96-1793(-)
MMQTDPSQCYLHPDSGGSGFMKGDVLGAARRVLHRFPEIILALGQPALEELYEVPRVPGTGSLIIETSDFKAVQVLLSRRGAQGRWMMMPPAAVHYGCGPTANPIPAWDFVSQQQAWVRNVAGNHSATAADHGHRIPRDGSVWNRIPTGRPEAAGKPATANARNARCRPNIGTVFKGRPAVQGECETACSSVEGQGRRSSADEWTDSSKRQSGVSDSIGVNRYQEHDHGVKLNSDLVETAGRNRKQSSDFEETAGRNRKQSSDFEEMAGRNRKQSSDFEETAGRNRNDPRQTKGELQKQISLEETGGHHRKQSDREDAGRKGLGETGGLSHKLSCDLVDTGGRNRKQSSGFEDTGNRNPNETAKTKGQCHKLSSDLVETGGHSHKGTGGAGETQGVRQKQSSGFKDTGDHHRKDSGDPREASAVCHRQQSGDFDSIETTDDPARRSSRTSSCLADSEGPHDTPTHGSFSTAIACTDGEDAEIRKTVKEPEQLIRQHRQTISSSYQSQAWNQGGQRGRNRNAARRPHEDGIAEQLFVGDAEVDDEVLQLIEGPPTPGSPRPWRQWR